MAEQKKPKIDLKARLGKKSVGAPSGTGSIPPPAAIPPPAFSSPGIPPPMGMPGMPGMPGQGPPPVDASDPYGSISAQHAAPKIKEPQAIKIEMGEEVIEAQKKAQKRVYVIAGLTALVGGILGFVVGGGSERGKQAASAIEGAGLLRKDIEAANAEAQKLTDVLGKAAKALTAGKYPGEEVSALGDINIPFKGDNLLGKGIGRFKPDLLGGLLRYAGIVDEANIQKEKLQSVLGGAKTPLEALLSEKQQPKVHWGVYVKQGPLGPWANMQPLPAPFLVQSDKKVKDKDGKETDYAWPADFKIKDGNAEVTLRRYTKGEAVASDPELIPVVPQTEALVCPDSTLVKLRRELGDMQQVLNGDSSDPTNPKPGLIELGEKLREQLQKIAEAGG